jgi:2-polyprenyl-3-methyl-5-hydroxy-6-metoxy-1,4-benzoquinol methylase
MGSALRAGAGFFLWQFALRRLGVRLPTRLSARIYASLVVAWAVRTRSRWTMLLVPGLAALWSGSSVSPTTRGHFDTLAPDYAEQLSPSARERVVQRKATIMFDALYAAGVQGPRLLDVGCGHGWYIETLEREGAQVTGIDLSPAQLAAARTYLGRSVPLTAGSVLAVPVKSGTFDGVYAVNVFHHLEDERLQTAALAELARVVRPGGLVFLHEINTRNPLFAFYMSYVFPLWKRIDRGTERWIDARRLPVDPSLSLRSLYHYTFLPDFAPVALTQRLEPLEHSLEHAIPAWSAHFTAIYQRVD